MPKEFLSQKSAILMDSESIDSLLQLHVELGASMYLIQSKGCPSLQLCSRHSLGFFPIQLSAQFVFLARGTAERDGIFLTKMNYLQFISVVCYPNLSISLNQPLKVKRLKCLQRQNKEIKKPGIDNNSTKKIDCQVKKKKSNKFAYRAKQKSATCKQNVFQN